MSLTGNQSVRSQDRQAPLSATWKHASPLHELGPSLSKSWPRSFRETHEVALLRLDKGSCCGSSFAGTAFRGRNTSGRIGGGSAERQRLALPLLSEYIHAAGNIASLFEGGQAGEPRKRSEPGSDADFIKSM